MGKRLTFATVLNETAENRKRHDAGSHAIGRPSSPAATFAIVWTYLGIITLASVSAMASEPATKPAESVTSLQGEWAFQLDPNDVGQTEAWQSQRLPDRIQLPSTTDEAGYGEKTKGADLANLSRVYKYVGPAWYQREIEVPPSWKDHEIELFLERVLWESKVWVDDRLCDTQDSLGTPHRHQLGQLAPGKHRLTVRVNNAMIHPIGVIGMSYTEDGQTIWNGILGRITLQAHAPLSIQRQRIFPSPDGTVRVELSLRNAQPQPLSGTVETRIVEHTSGKVVGTANAPVNIPGGGAEDYLSEITVTLGEAPKLWSEFSPELYRAESRIEATVGEINATDSAAATFGFRTVSRLGPHFAINGRPTFVRGNLDCGVFPRTGHPRCDVDYWRRLFAIYKDYGLNQVRFHSWCPPEAAFQAADEMGIYIQAEVIWIDSNALPQTTGVGHAFGTLDQYVRAEMRRMFDTYGNHPSFAFFVIGNEMGGSNFDVMAEWIQEEKQRDPRRLYSASTARTITPTDDFNDSHLIPGVDLVVSYGKATPHTDWDYEPVYSRAPVPIIAHELGQMVVYPCWSEIAKYTGVLQARYLETYRQLARQHGIEAQDQELRQASGASNRIVYKAEMEAQLRTPSSGGISWLGMQDLTGQGAALWGWLDAFYDSKGFITPAQFRRFCSSTVPLLRFKKFVWTNAEEFQATAQVAHWGPQPLHQIVAEWRLRTPDGHTIAQGTLAPTDIPLGAPTTLGQIAVDLKPVSGPTRLNLELSIPNTEFANDWDLWVFPATATASSPANVVVCDRVEVATAALANGERVLLLAHQLGAESNVRYAQWVPVFFNGTAEWANPNRETLGALVRNQHPALAGFPTEAHLDWQWYDVCAGAHGFVLDDLPPDYRPIVQPVSDFHFNHKLGSLFEFRTKQGGKLLVCGYNVADDLANRPAARQLRQSLLDYLNSPAFDPQQEVAPDYLTRLFSGETK